MTKTTATQMIFLSSLLYSRFEPLEPQRVAHDAHRRKPHRGRGEHGVEEYAEGRVEGSRGNRNKQNIIDERPEQVLPYVPYRGAAQGYGRDYRPEVPADKRDVGSLHSHIRAGAYGNPDIGLRERRRVVYAVAAHTDLP